MEQDDYRFFLEFGTFEEVNCNLGEGQEQYQTLPTYCDNKSGRIVFRMVLSDEQIKRITHTKEIWFEQLMGENLFQPVRASALKDDLMKPQTQIILPEVLVVYSSEPQYLEEFYGELEEQEKPDLYTDGDLLYHGTKTGSLLSDKHKLIVINMTQSDLGIRNYVEQFCRHNRQNGRCIVVLTTDQYFGVNEDFYRVVLKDN